MKLANAVIIILTTSTTLVTGHKGLRHTRTLSECPDNEAFEECGTACPATCSNKDEVQKCTKQCVRGCFCADGYVRKDTPTSACILQETCPPKCSANEVYKECGTSCPATCSNKDTISPCNMMCVEGCFCAEGYIRENDTGGCILKENCPSNQTTPRPRPRPRSQPQLRPQTRARARAQALTDAPGIGIVLILYFPNSS
eukprot:CAMPEP_0197435122 /NCGR_PEP_ID=MMETSP1175-20131217/2760_1 /TAXON_ID=1003142 /ORGANISM="Triceratium dubium, Strain CCMP147" /LENGTH=198 /DNA_ID=CAMNT_0042964069 /DNA_START=54 /DNA_END=651 /DNA_ORIENTATION=+